jgi:hypothetical protein
MYRASTCRVLSSSRHTAFHGVTDGSHAYSWPSGYLDTESHNLKARRQASWLGDGELEVITHSNDSVQRHQRDQRPAKPRCH